MKKTFLRTSSVITWIISTIVFAVMLFVSYMFFSHASEDTLANVFVFVAVMTFMVISLIPYIMSIISSFFLKPLWFKITGIVISVLLLLVFLYVGYLGYSTITQYYVTS